MAYIQPFKAIRYNRADISELIAPPYDILGKRDKTALLNRDDHNIVAIDLPHIPPKTAGPDQLYAQAAGDLTCWLDIHTLGHDPRPALYAYHQTFSCGGRTLTRKTFFARLRLEPFGSGSIFPHEQTFGGPKEDRLKLTMATRCQISPIFGLYPDDGNEIAGLMDEAIQDEPDQCGMLDDVENKLWVIDDLPTIKSIQVRLSDKPIFIADGHHRYETALMYRRKQIEASGTPAEDAPVHFVLAVLGSMNDPCALIQPYHRTIVKLPSLTINALHTALVDTFSWTPTAVPEDAEQLAERLAGESPQAMVLYIAKDDACVIVRPREPDPLAALDPEHTPAWRQLAYTLLHRCVVKSVLRTQFNNGKAVTVHYHKNFQQAIDDARKSTGLAALMPATTMAQLREICTAGERMPQKSTYFYPKLATGMVINPLY